MKAILNTQLTPFDVETLRKIDPSYLPRKNFALNRSITDEKMVVQLDINYNICEVVVPQNQEYFKQNFLNYIVEFVTNSVRKLFPPRIANEIGYKIFFYVPESTPGADEKWWNLTSYTFYKSRVETETIFGTKLNSYNTRFILHLHLNDSGQLIKVPSNTITFTGTVSNVSPSSNFSSPAPSGSSVSSGYSFGTPAPSSNFSSPMSGTSPFTTSDPFTFGGAFGGVSFASPSGFGGSQPSQGPSYTTGSGFGGNVAVPSQPSSYSGTQPSTQSTFGGFGGVTSQTNTFGGFGGFGATQPSVPNTLSAPNVSSTPSNPNTQNTFGGFGTFGSATQLSQNNSTHNSTQNTFGGFGSFT